MFPLHEKTRRRVCRVVFLVFCVVPTLAVLAWAAGRGGSATQAVQSQWGLVTGLNVKIARVTYPRPGAASYHDLRLSDPETGRVLLTARSLETARRDGALVLLASQLELGDRGEPLRNHEVRRLWRLVTDTLARQGLDDAVPVQLSADRVTWFAPGGAQTFLDLHGRIHSTARAAVAIRFHLPGAESSKKIDLHLQRDRSYSPPRTSLSINTWDAKLPCWMLTAFTPAAQRLGPKAVFAGAATARESEDGFDGEATGRLLGVDLDSLVSEQFPHKLSGQADVTLRRIRFTGGRVREVSAWLRAGPGQIGPSLLEAAARHLKLRVGAPLKSTEPIAYRQLAFALEMDRAGISMTGQCEASEGAVLVADGVGPLLNQSDQPPQPVLALVRMLVQDSQVQAPATAETQWLLSRLPIPQLVPPPDRSGKGPRAKVLRLHPRSDQ